MLGLFVLLEISARKYPGQPALYQLVFERTSTRSIC